MPDRAIGPIPLTEPQLIAWGEAIGRTIDSPAVFALRGELGAGKSVLARAIARGAGVRGPMPSPTFNLRFEYRAFNGRMVDHIDLYRLDDPDEVWELGWRELESGARIVLIEWPERAEEVLPRDRWDVTLRVPGHGRAPDAAGAAELRIITAAAHGAAPELPAPEAAA